MAPSNVPTIYVDADACPVKGEIYKVALRYSCPVKVVSNTFLSVPKSPLIENVTVRTRFNSADDWIAKQINQNDIAITEDIELASRCLEKGALVLGTRGNVFTDAAIGNAMASRELMAALRDQGLVSGGPDPFRDHDRSRFLQKMDQTVSQVIRRLEKSMPPAGTDTDPAADPQAD